MDAPTFDADGYPTDETLQAIREWPSEDSPERSVRFVKLMEFVREAWKYADWGYFRAEGDIYRISTAGWSGNERIIDALEENFNFWIICWRMHRRGGHYEFELPVDAEQKHPIEMRLVLFDWRSRKFLPLSVEEDVRLTSGVFHSGSTFNATLELTTEQAAELKEAIKQGFQPSFWVEVKG